MTLLLRLGLGCSPRDDRAQGDAAAPELPSAPAPEEGPVTVHPRVATMLVVEWDQAEDTDEAWLSWTVEGEAHRSPSEALAAGPARRVVLGVPAETRVDDIAVHARVGGAETVLALGSATTGSLPGGLTDAVLTDSDPSMRPEPWLLTSVDVGPQPFFGPCYTVILDARGRIVWYRPSEGSRLTWQPQVSSAGDTLLVDEVLTYTFGDPGTANVTRLTLDFAVQDPIALPGMITFDALDDGGFVWAEAETERDFHLVRRRPDGTDERIWSCRPWMQSYSDAHWACATNTTRWDPERGTVLWSTFETRIVLEVSLDTGEVVREYGPYPGGYAFEPPDATFDRQHMPGRTAEGTLLVSVHDGERQVAREYEVDETEQVLRLILELETPDHATYGGEIHRLPSGNLLWQLGTAGVIQEVSPEGAVLWRVAWPGHLVGNTTPIADLYALTR